MGTSDRPELRVDPAAPARATEPLRTATGRVGQAVPNDGLTPSGRQARRDHEHAVSTAGQLRPAYAQYVVDRETHDVSVRIRDAATDEVIDQVPSAEMAAMDRSLREYSEALARKHAAAEAKANA